MVDAESKLFLFKGRLPHHMSQRRGGKKKKKDNGLSCFNLAKGKSKEEISVCG